MTGYGIEEDLEDGHPLVHAGLVELAAASLLGARRDEVSRILSDKDVVKPEEIAVTAFDFEAHRSGAYLVADEVGFEEPGFDQFGAIGYWEGRLTLKLEP